jgi:DNA-binding transcriptional ArsR family regulator
VSVAPVAAAADGAVSSPRGDDRLADRRGLSRGGHIEDRDPSTISRNLTLLRQQGFVIPRRQGQMKYYSLDIARIEEAFADFVRFLREAKTRVK